MRRPFRSIRFGAAALAVLTAMASPPAGAQSIAKVEDAGSRTAALAARMGAWHVAPIERSARDVVRLAAIDASTAASMLTPYRSTPAQDASSGGFAMRLPGTGLDLTNGSLMLRHTNDGRYGKGAQFSVQLTY